jgi:hypothetical protein
MSDYLDSLVAKTLGNVPAVLPRPVSKFEPLQPATLFQPGTMSVESDEAPAAMPASAEPATQGAVSEKRFSAKPAPVGAPAAGQPGPEFQTPPPPVQPDAPVQVDNATESPLLRIHHEVVEQTAHAAARRIEDIDGQRETPRVRQHIEEPESDTGEQPQLRALPQTPIPVHTQPGVTPQRVRSLPDRTGRPQQTTLRAGPPAPLPGSLVVPSVVERPAIRQARDPVRPEATRQVLPMSAAPIAIREAPPTIRVTIGRVDVRAVMPEQPARLPQPEARKAAPSLEEYLRQRSAKTS